MNKREIKMQARIKTVVSIKNMYSLMHNLPSDLRNLTLMEGMVTQKITANAVQGLKKIMQAPLVIIKKRSSR